jgi:hypothetical protein
MFVFVFVLCFVGSAFCDKLIIRAEDSYRVYVYECKHLNCVWSINLKKKTRLPNPDLGCRATEKKY